MRFHHIMRDSVNFVFVRFVPPIDNILIEQRLGYVLDAFGDAPLMCLKRNYTYLSQEEMSVSFG